MGRLIVAAVAGVLLTLMSGAGADVAIHTLDNGVDFLTGVPLDGLARQKRSTHWTGLRILAHYDGSIMLNAELSSFVKRHLAGVLDFFRDAFAARNPLAPGKRLRLNSDCVERRYAICAGNQLCATDCMNVSRCGSVLIPSEHLSQCHRLSEDGHCTDSPALSNYTGVADTDFILYVSFRKSDRCGSMGLAYASHCRLERSLDRPVAGFFNICPYLLTVLDLTSPTAGSQFQMIAKHELFHALGFSNSLFAFYRDTNGQPFTSRAHETNLPPLNANRRDYVAGPSTVRQVVHRNWLTRFGVAQHPVTLLTTPNVRQAVRDHFNCTTLEGAELENQGGTGTHLTHFEKRIFFDEIMAPIMSSDTRVSRLTFAVMEDTGWYQVNYSYAQPLNWGKGLGCSFATSSCLSWIENRQRASLPTWPFCNRLRSTDASMVTSCNSALDTIVSCNLIAYPVGSVPSDYQYFTVDNVVSNELSNVLNRLEGSSTLAGEIATADYCPIEQPLTWHRSSPLGTSHLTESNCNDPTNQPLDENNAALEVYGAESACFSQASQWKRYAFGAVGFSRRTGSGCYRFRCDHSLRFINLLTANGLIFANCSRAGQIANVHTNFESWLYNGSLVCPDFADLCAQRLNTASLPTTSTLAFSDLTETTTSSAQQFNATSTLTTSPLAFSDLTETTARSAQQFNATSTLTTSPLAFSDLTETTARSARKNSEGFGSASDSGRVAHCLVAFWLATLTAYLLFY